MSPWQEGRAVLLDSEPQSDLVPLPGSPDPSQTWGPQVPSLNTAHPHPNLECPSCEHCLVPPPTQVGVSAQLSIALLRPFKAPGWDGTPRPRCWAWWGAAPAEAPLCSRCLPVPSALRLATQQPGRGGKAWSEGPATHPAPTRLLQGGPWMVGCHGHGPQRCSGPASLAPETLG